MLTLNCTGQATLVVPMWLGVLYLPWSVLHRIKGMDLLIYKIMEPRMCL